MGYSNSFMFCEELISWSIDGGGNFFYRKKHCFNITNVCGYMRLCKKYDYRFVYEYLNWQFKKMHFDYVSKAHPSVIRTMYYLPNASLEYQCYISNVFSFMIKRKEIYILELAKILIIKNFLLTKLFV
jgi:type I restriction enzyme S subunit